MALFFYAISQAAACKKQLATFISYAKLIVEKLGIN